MKLLPGLLVSAFLPALFVQAQRLEFEVASVRPSPPINTPEGQRIDVGLHIDNKAIHINALSMKSYIAWAYQVKNYQINGPDWLDSERYDINATLPEGANSDQIGDMLRTLLEDRFGLKVHKTQKEFTAYVLQRGKKPLTLKPVEIQPTSGDGVMVGGSGSRDGIAVNLGRGASYTFANNKLEGKKLSMDTLVDTLAGFVDLPVVNRTNLDGYYDISLELTPEDYRTMMIRAGLNNGVTLPPQALKLLETASNASLFDAIDRVGLKMESRKEPLNVINVDQLSKNATEN